MEKILFDGEDTAPFLCCGVCQFFQTGGMWNVKGSGSIRCELMGQEGWEECKECPCLCRTPFSSLASLSIQQHIKEQQLAARLTQQLFQNLREEQTQQTGAKERGFHTLNSKRKTD